MKTLPQLRSLSAIQLSQAEVFACCEILCYYDLIALRKYGKAVKPGFTLLVSNTTQRRANVKLYLSIVFYALRFLNSGLVIFLCHVFNEFLHLGLFKIFFIDVLLIFNKDINMRICSIALLAIADHVYNYNYQ